jgi:hypothetical protein
MLHIQLLLLAKRRRKKRTTTTTTTTRLEKRSKTLPQLGWVASWVGLGGGGMKQPFKYLAGK